MEKGFLESGFEVAVGSRREDGEIIYPEDSVSPGRFAAEGGRSLATQQITRSESEHL